jgi:hypothetical protein
VIECDSNKLKRSSVCSATLQDTKHVQGLLNPGDGNFEVSLEELEKPQNLDANQSRNPKTNFLWIQNRWVSELCFVSGNSKQSGNSAVSVLR